MTPPGAAGALRIGLLVENAAPFVFEEVRALRALGVEVDVASVFRPPPRRRWDRLYGVPVRYPAPGLGSWCRHALPAVAAPLGAARLVRAARAEGAPLRLVALAASLARHARRRGWRHVHASFASQPAWLAWAVGLLADLPFSFTGHAYDVQQPFPWLARLLGEAQFVRAISGDGARRLRALCPAAAARLRVGTLGVDVERFQPRPARRQDPPLVLCVAQLGPTKGIEVLVGAAARLASAGASFAVDVMGEGPLRRDLERRIRGHGLEGVVRLRGHASRAAVRAALARARVFALPCRVLPDRRHDGLPVALLEAMAAGLPVVTTSVGGIPEVVEDGRNGRLVAPGDIGGLAGVLGALLAEESECARLGEAARHTVVSHFRADQAAARLRGWMADAGGAQPEGSPAGRPLLEAAS